MKYSHVLWDFNGTLFNDVDIGIKSANILLRRHGLKELDGVASYHKVFCFPIIDYYRKLGFDFDVTPYNDLAVEWVEIYNGLAQEARLYDGALQLLKFLKNAGVKQYVLSATELKMLTSQLRDLDIYDYFHEVLGTGNIYAYSKKDIAVKWAEKNSPCKAVLIGDTLHDKEVADAAGFDCILVANGHEPKSKLETSGAVVVDNIENVSHLI